MRSGSFPRANSSGYGRKEIFQYRPAGRTDAASGAADTSAGESNATAGGAPTGCAAAGALAVGEAGVEDDADTGTAGAFAPFVAAGGAATTASFLARICSVSN